MSIYDFPPNTLFPTHQGKLISGHRHRRTASGRSLCGCHPRRMGARVAGNPRMDYGLLRVVHMFAFIDF
jgi:hypothetical protein